VTRNTGALAQVLLVTSPQALHDTPGAQPSHLDGVGAVCNATARQVCCDAQITTVAITRNGTILDVGRTRREPSARQRAAVIARDRGCVGCGAPVARCQVHHIRWWRNGGATNIDNLCLLCWSCHAHVHHHGWTVHGMEGSGS
jgi:NAD-dependent dihydropyrimidine dehydrogenase PreA subunit